MIVVLDAGGVTIAEADDCRRLHVTAPPAVDVNAVLESSGLGRLSGAGEALLNIAELHGRAADVSTGEDWPAAWQSMIDYAVSRGWVTPDGQEVIAHVEVI